MFGSGALRRGPAAVIALLLMVALLASACGGGDSDSDGDAGDGGATSTATSASNGDGAGGSDGPGDPEGSAAPSGDGGGDDFGSIGEMTSYRYTMTMNLGAGAFGTEGLPGGTGAEDMEFTMEVEGESIAPDSNRSHVVANLGFIAFDIERIEIGDEAWTRENGGAWQPEAEGDLALDGGVAVDPQDYLGGDDAEEFRERLQDHPYEEETVDGVATRRYEFTGQEWADSFAGAEALPTDDATLTDSTITMWIAEDLGVPVKMMIEGLTAEGEPGLSMEMRFFDINSDGITIEPPM